MIIYGYQWREYKKGRSPGPVTYIFSDELSSPSLSVKLLEIYTFAYFFIAAIFVLVDMKISLLNQNASWAAFLFCWCSISRRYNIFQDEKLKKLNSYL